MAPAKTPAATAKKKKVHKAPKVVLNSRYERGEALGSGAFGTIYKGSCLYFFFFFFFLSYCETCLINAFIN
jgi:hypothetical protein